jgi:hypothetical protein
MNPGGFRIDLSTVPGPIVGLWTAANAMLRGAWTMSERLRELIRLHSAFEHQCHT